MSACGSAREMAVIRAVHSIPLLWPKMNTIIISPSTKTRIPAAGNFPTLVSTSTPIKEQPERRTLAQRGNQFVANAASRLAPREKSGVWFALKMTPTRMDMEAGNRTTKRVMKRAESRSGSIGVMTML